MVNNMPIPDAITIEEHKKQVIALLREAEVILPEDWEIEIEVRPYLGSDIQYGTRLPDEKVLWFLVYSARYPTTWNVWIREAIAEIAGYFKAKGIGIPA